MSTPIPVTPGVTVYDDCNIDLLDVEGITYATLEYADGISITALPADGYIIVPDLDAGWDYDPHATTSSIDIACSVPITEEIVETPVEIDTLPATGLDPGLAALGLIGAAAIAAGIHLTRRRTPNQANRSKE